MKKLLISLIILIIIILGIITIFNTKTNPTLKNNGKLNIITSIYPIYDLTKEVAGDKANVSMLLSPGVEIHDFEPTPQDIIYIEEANLFLYTGEELEPWAKTVISGIDNKEHIKDISANISLIENHEESEHSEHEEHEKYDTHIWLDPQKTIQLVKNIQNELCNKDSKNAEYYKNNAQAYIKKLEQLDSEIYELVSNSNNKKIAFGGPFSYIYFIKRYNLNYISAYDSCGENGEPSIEKITTVINTIKEDKIPVIFYKELSSGQIANTISQETGAEKLEFNSIHSISQKDIENGENYLSIMYKNLENLKKALK